VPIEDAVAERDIDPGFANVVVEMAAPEPVDVGAKVVDLVPVFDCANGGFDSTE
jgi:hypothetical protein